MSTHPGREIPVRFRRYGADCMYHIFPALQDSKLDAVSGNVLVPQSLWAPVL